MSRTASLENVNLRKGVEKDLMQLQEELSESESSSSSSGDSSNNGYRSDNEIQSKPKEKSSKHNQGQDGGSKKNTASKKTHQNQSKLFSDDECVIQVERKSNPNKNSSSGKHKKEQLRQGNTGKHNETSQKLEKVQRKRTL